MLEERLIQAKEAKTLPELEELYFGIAYDYGFLCNEMKETYRKVQQEKKGLGQVKSVAELERLFEDTQTYLELINNKFELKGLEKLMIGVRVKIDSQRAESKGTY